MLRASLKELVFNWQPLFTFTYRYLKDTSPEDIFSKTAFSHLSRQQMKRITFGVYREDRLIQNIFARVDDLPHAPDSPPMGHAIRSLFVTRIILLRNE